MLKYLWLVFVLALAPPAGAQTAEETVLFLLFGFEDGMNNEHMQIRQLNHNTWNVRAYGDQWNKWQVLQTSPCVYRMVAGLTLDVNFNNMSEFSTTQGNRHTRSNIRIAGKQVIRIIREGQASEWLNEYDSDVETTPERHRKAVEYFRAKFCKGRAF